MTTTIELPVWVATSCPEWCRLEHKAGTLWSDESEMHARDFGNDASGRVTVYAHIDASGRVLSTEVVSAGIESLTDVSDVYVVAGWFQDAAAFMREVTPAKE